MPEHHTRQVTTDKLERGYQSPQPWPNQPRQQNWINSYLAYYKIWFPRRAIRHHSSTYTVSVLIPRSATCTSSLPPHEARCATLWRPWSSWMDIQNIPIFRLLGDSWPRVPHGCVFLHGWTGVVLVPVDGSKWIFPFLSGDVAGARIAIRSVILWRSTGSSVQAPANRHSFERLANRTISLPPSCLLSCFVSGLIPELRHEVQALRPLSLPQATKLARLQEDKMLDRRCGNRSSSHPPNPNFSNKPPTHSLTLLSKIPLKWLTIEEMAIRRDQGLCYHCDEKWLHGHWCKPRLHILIVDEDLEPSSGPSALDSHTGSTINTPLTL